MCNADVSPELQALIVEVVQEWDAENRPKFTAYDVSKEVQKRAKDKGLPFVRHAVIGAGDGSPVHDALMPSLQSGKYERVQINVGAPIMPWLYFLSGTDPMPQKKDAKPAAVATVAKPVDSNSNDATMGTDRLNVPSFLVRAVGFVGGDTVYVADADPNGKIQKPCLLLMKDKPDNPLAEYKVSNDSRIRITPAIIKLAGLPSDEGTKYEVDGDNGTIIVTLK